MGNISILFAQVYLDEAKQFLKDKKFNEAIDVLEKIIDDTDIIDAETYFVLGKAYMAIKEFEDASDSFEEATELENDNSEYHFWLGRAYGADAQESNVFSQELA